MFEYRQVLARMRQGDSDRDIASARLMGRGKLKTVSRSRLPEAGSIQADPSDDAELAAIFGRNPKLPRSCVSTIEPFRDLVREWFDAGVQGTTIFSALERNLGYSGSYSAVRHFFLHLKAECGVKATKAIFLSPTFERVAHGATPTPRL